MSTDISSETSQMVLDKAAEQLENAGAEQRRNGLKQPDGTVVGTVVDTEALQDAFGNYVVAKIKSGHPVSVIPFSFGQKDTKPEE